MSHRVPEAGMTDKPTHQEPEEEPQKYTRREIFEKYGPYTAPVVVSMLLPNQVYANNDGSTYTTVASCQANHPLMPNGMPASSGQCQAMHGAA